MSDGKSKCPICKGKTEREPEQLRLQPRIHQYTCRSCGVFAMDFVHAEHWASELAEMVPPYKLSALLRERWIAYSDKVSVHFDPFEGQPVLNHVPVRAQDLLLRWPASVPDRLDRSLLNLARMAEDSDGAGTWHPTNSGPSLFFARDGREMTYHIDSLISWGWLVREGARALVCVTPEGWQRVQELRELAPRKDAPVFVAMWFGGKDDQKEMLQLYKTGIEQGVEDAGYKCTRSDLTPHNDWIMDKIIADINVAPFVVADFTGNALGVYYEAGLARGRGIPVIQTC